MKADLHIHSCLSPCGDWEMSPLAIAARGIEEGLDMMALSDHNAVGNLPAFFCACEAAGIVPVGGIEVTSEEEAHVLCLFPDLEKATEFGSWIHDHLPDIPNDPEQFGDQVAVDENEEVLYEEPKLLISAVSLNLDEILAKTHAMGGLYIPAHVDKPRFSLTSQLGFIPKMDYDALEVADFKARLLVKKAVKIGNSDAHYLSDVGKRFTVYETEEASFEALRDCLHRGALLPGSRPYRF
ncbi:MAG: PHP domain-containing protein [Spirochaetia bacterium]|nr:PHP domain-containing protein [Spirochaetia bacterium]